MISIPYPKKLSISDYNKTWRFDVENDCVKGVFLIDQDIYARVIPLNPETGEPELYPDDDPSYDFYAGDFKTLLFEPDLRVLTALEVQALIDCADRVEHN